MENPHSGNAYAGVMTYHLGSEERENIGIHLNQQLIGGQKYYCSFYISLAANFKIATNKIGIKLSIDPYSQLNPIQTNNMDMIYSDSVSSIQTGWIKISGSFKADSAYNYFVLGNYFDNANADTLWINGLAYFGYLYIDDICLSTDSILCTNFSTNIPPQINPSPLTVYPNPVFDFIHIEMNTEEEYKIELKNIQGQILPEKYKIRSAKNSINIRNLKPGIYFLMINK